VRSSAASSDDSLAAPVVSVDDVVLDAAPEHPTIDVVSAAVVKRVRSFFFFMCASK
jgi:hypothetical protein